MSLPSLRTAVFACLVLSLVGLRVETAQAVTIDFEDLTAGTVLSNQYAAIGATFTPNVFIGPGSSTSMSPWATNTDMTIVSSTGADVGGLGTPALVSGNILRSFGGWLNEDGDPSFLVTFSTPVSSFSATFAGVSTGADVTIFAYNGAVLLGTVSGASTGQFVLSFANPSITSVAVRPGSFNDWVGVDNITFTPLPTPPTLIISEFRLRGPNGANDEFIEIYNNGNLNHTVASVSGTGYAVAASDGIVRCTIPNGTFIPKAGHFLCTNSVGYSIGNYPSGSGTATGNATYATDIADNAGIALFNNNSGGGSFTLANRLDAVGSTAEGNVLYKEGNGYPALTPFSIDYAWVRDQCGKGGAVNLLGPCTISSPKDTGDNAADFYFVDTNGTSAGGGQRLGAPGPQNLGSPVSGGNLVATLPLDATVVLTPPNAVRDFTSNPANNSTFGTISIRKRFVNNTGASLTRLRLRIVDLDTFPAASGFADLRPITSGAVVVAGINDAATCAATGAPATPPCTVTVQGSTLEQPPSQPNGGGFNSSLGVGTVTLGTPLANGASINVQFLFGIQQTGAYRVGFIAEGLPAGGDVFMVSCFLDGPCGPTLASAGSRRVHGGVPYDLPLSLVAPPSINTNPTTEPRQGPAQALVFTFDRPINAATASVTEGAAAIGVMNFVGNSVTVPLTGVTDRQYVTVSLTNVTGTDGSTGGVGSARVGFLAGDVNQNRVITLTDLGLVNAQLAQPVTAANFKTDVNVSGTITLADKAITNANLTGSLPPP